MDFLMTLVINDTQKSFSSKNLHFDGEFFCVPREFLGIDADLKIPLYKENDRWFIRSVNADLSNESQTSLDLSLAINAHQFIEKNVNSQKDAALIAMIDGKVIEEKEISDNDVFAIFDKGLGFHYSITFKSTAKLKLKAELFECKQTTISVGKNSSCDICYDYNNLVLDQHFVIELTNSLEATVSSTTQGNTYVSANFYINGSSSTRGTVTFGDTISLRDLSIVFLGNHLAITGSNVRVSQKALEHKTNVDNIVEINGSNMVSGAEKKQRISRIPRKTKKLNDNVIEIDLPPQPTTSKKMPAILTIGPSLTMSMAMLVSLGVSVSNVLQGGNKATLITSGALAFSMLLGAVLWPLLTRAYQKRQDKKAEKNRKERYEGYLSEKRSIIQLLTEENSVLLNNEYYKEPKAILDSFENPEELRLYLYSKQPGDFDFLHTRVGKGIIANSVKTSIPAKSFVLYDDPLRDKAYKLCSEYSKIDDMPITIFLKDKRIIGIQNNSKSSRSVLRSLIMSLTFYHAYDDVKTAFILNEHIKSSFGWIKDLPHAYSDSKDLRFMASTRSEVHQLFSAFNEIIDLRETDSKQSAVHYIVFVFDAHLIENEMLINRILRSDANLGFTLVFVSNGQALPKECEVIVDEDAEGHYIYYKADQIKQYFSTDLVGQDDWDTYFSRLRKYSINLLSTAQSIPERLSFLDMYQVGNVKQLNISKRWKENLPYKSMAVPVGVRAGGEVLNLDMHELYHGPHGLAAGMTGSGKSEFLQTLILSLAINFSPDEVSFVIIDFKGGGMANSFQGLPHLAGTMTNLSGNELNRAMVTIQAETARRQQKFKEYSVNHIDKYQKMYAENKDKMDPLPHLIIIADEFAELKTQQPEFMKQLIELARIGRSLGIHLLLATQKPAGVVDDQIWGNSRFRICLKVLEKQDSTEMIRRPDAALIKLPGRCYMQVGYDEVFEYFQSGYSGEPYVSQQRHHDFSDDILEEIDSCGMTITKASLKYDSGNKNYTQLNAILDEIKRVSAEEGFVQHRLWLDPLPHKINLDKLIAKCYPYYDGRDWHENTGYSAVVGMVDHPALQRQMSYAVDFSHGNYGIYGISSSGKSTFLQSLLYSLCLKYSPAKMQFYILDFSSRVLSAFSNMPHVNDIGYSDDDAKVKQIIEELVAEIDRRNRMFGERGVSSLDSFNNNSIFKLPMIVLMIDNYSVISERYNQITDKLVKIVRSGSTYGVNVVITSTGRNIVYSRVADCLTNSIALYLPDKLNYRELLRTSSTPEIDNCSGRGLIAFEKQALEFQAALVIGTTDDAKRTTEIKKLAVSMAKTATDHNLISSQRAGTIEKHSLLVGNERTPEEPQFYSEVNSDSAPCIIRPESIGSNNINEIFIGRMNDKKCFFDFNQLKTLFVMGNSHAQNVRVINAIAKQLSNHQYPLFVFDVNKELDPLSNSVFTTENNGIATGIAQLFATIKASSAGNIVVIIPDLPGLYKALDETSGARLGTLTGATSAKRACFVVEGSPKELAKLTGCEVGANLRRDKNARGIYVNEFVDGDILFDNVKETATFKNIKISPKQGFVIGDSGVLCELEGLI